MPQAPVQKPAPAAPPKTLPNKTTKLTINTSPAFVPNPAFIPPPPSPKSTYYSDPRGVLDKNVFALDVEDPDWLHPETVRAYFAPFKHLGNASWEPPIAPGDSPPPAPDSPPPLRSLPIPPRHLKERRANVYKDSSAPPRKWPCPQHNTINFGCKRCNPTGEPMKFPF